MALPLPVWCGLDLYRGHFSGRREVVSLSTLPSRSQGLGTSLSDAEMVDHKVDCTGVVVHQQQDKCMN